MSALDRRRFLVAAAAAGGAGAGWYLVLRGGDADRPGANGPRPSGADSDTLVGLFGDLDAAARVGGVYLDEHPQAVDRPGTVSIPAAPSEVGERARRDFVDGDVVAVDGWVLPRSVADLCAGAHRIAA